MYNYIYPNQRKAVTEMNSVNMAHIALHVSALLVSITSIVFTLIQQRTDKIQNKIYIVLISIVGFNSVTQIINSAMQPLVQSSDGAYLVVRVCDYLYFMFHAALCPMFLVYVYSVCGIGKFSDLKRRLCYSLLFIVNELLILLNPLLHWVYRYEDRAFTRSWGESLIYIAAVFYLGVSLFRLLFSWNALTAKRRLALIYFFVIVIAGVVLQLVNKDLQCELFTEALALLGVMTSIESEDDRIDIDTGIYNRKALQTDLTSYILNKRPVGVICVKITNLELFERTANFENPDILPTVVAAFLRTLVPRYCIYNTNPGTFILTETDGDPARSMKIAEIISRRFDHTWHFGENELLLNAVVMTSSAPERIKTANDAFYMADSPVPANLDKKILTGRDLDYLMRRAAVENALARGFEEGGFEVYYQPTYSLTDRKLHGAEALIRLHDSLLGNIFPDEFIPIAEQNGLIDDIDDFVLREVCSFIKSGVPASLGVSSINVNLSVIECMQPGFVKHINDITEEYDIDKNMINFEITESIAASNYEVLSKVVKALKDDGFHFSMDDYGTGYSNMRAIFMLDFDVVKIDKSILWSAEESELGRIILESSVHMIKQMHRKILVEGVETENQIELLKALAVDYLQGYFFSKPVPKAEFIAKAKAGKQTTGGR